MASTLATVMYNWMTGLGEIRRKQGLSLTRNDFTNQWGDLGATIYDWGKNLTSQDPQAWQNYGKTEGVFEGMVDQLSGNHPVGGAMGQYYPQPKPAPGEFGDMAKNFYAMVSQHVANNGGISRDALINSWGDLGSATWDYLTGIGQPERGIIPDEAQFTATVSYLAKTYSPGGTQGSIYKLAQGPQDKIDAATLALLNQQITNAKASGAFTDAQVAQLQAQIANMPTVQQAQALIGQNLDNARLQGLISDANLAIAKANLANMPTPGQAQQQIQGQINLLNQQIDNARIQGLIDQATADKLKAEIANMPTVAQAQAKIKQELDNLAASGALTSANAALINAQIANMPTPGQAGAMTDAQIANLVSQGVLTEAQAANMRAQTAKIGADLQANPRDWVNAWFYQRNMQPPTTGGPPASAAQPTEGRRFIGPPVSAEPPVAAGDNRLRTLPAVPADQPPNVPPRTGPGYLGPPASAAQPPATSPGVVVPPWLNDIAQNKAAPAFSGQSATLGNFPLQAPAPNQVSAKVYNNMAPSEQAGLEGLASSSGWFWPDYIKKMYASQQRQPQMGANPTPQWAGF